MWNYPAEPSTFTGGRVLSIPQGKTLGGGTSVNGMAYNRGQRADFDCWAAAGNPGWSYDDLLPIFKDLETHKGDDPKYRGCSGPLTISEKYWQDPVTEAFIKAA